MHQEIDALPFEIHNADMKLLFYVNKIYAIWIVNFSYDLKRFMT